ncbi:prepilin-type N-terminal cleavage/methylation domain-containing protein [Clostridium beijerinckii]|jgi:type IV pilus assembly protein PilA|uniref:Prepilin-type N-terminal cleavage/methylation domain-containing protein n=1 Tax=Clostridium beijerinckii TaxID=1520 RepID=A0A7X9XMX8_CLOBE|nr:prepilin-type N-terminal cleavage/methylation domain-containing protein [Clostridium beijerinckii]NMF03346.1 prepilin-type N-terminal cleavage/methylation domain-containing protein [Clostridium beijerinckii]
MKRVSLTNQKKKGFTLVELIIVIAIIAILAAIAIPKFGEMRQTANVKADIATAKNIATIVAADIADNKIKVDQSGDINALKDTNDNSVSILGDLDSGSATAKVAEGDGSNFNVVISKEGNVRVLVGNYEVYPTVSDGSNHDQG